MVFVNVSVFLSLYFKVLCLFFSFPLFKLLPLSRRNPFWGLLGAGVPPLLGALPLVAYWGALNLFNYSLLSTH